MVPSAMTRTRSAWRIVDRRCAMTMRVAEDSRIVRMTTDCVTLSNALVASSSRRIAGSPAIAAAIITRCRWPPLSPKPPSPTGVSRPSGSRARSSVSPARSTIEASASSLSRRGPQMQSRIVVPSGCEDCRTIPICLRTDATSTVERSDPSYATMPDQGSSKPSSRRIRVDFPPPDGPTRATNSPGSTANDKLESSGVRSRR